MKLTHLPHVALIGIAGWLFLTGECVLAIVVCCVGYVVADIQRNWSQP